MTASDFTVLKKQDVPYVRQYSTSDTTICWCCITLGQVLAACPLAATAVEQPLSKCDILITRMSPYTILRNHELCTALRPHSMIAA